MEKSFIQRCAEKYDPTLKVMIGASSEENVEHGTTFCRQDNRCFMGEPCIGEECRIQITDCGEEGREEGQFHTHPSREDPEMYLRPSGSDLYSGLLFNHSFGVIGNEAGIIAYRFNKQAPEYQVIKREVDMLEKRRNRFNEAIDDFDEAEELGIIPERVSRKLTKYAKTEKSSLRKERKILMRIIQGERENLVEPVEWKGE